MLKGNLIIYQSHRQGRIFFSRNTASCFKVRLCGLIVAGWPLRMAVLGAFVLELLVLVTVTGEPALEGPVTVTAITGQTVTINCKYNEKYRQNVKYWCRVLHRYNCNTLTTTLYNAHNVNIKDNPLANTFTVTMQRPEERDSGQYRCGIKMSNSYKTFNVELKVLSLIGPQVVTGIVGGLMKVDCKYRKGYSHLKKYWCRMEDNWCETLVDTFNEKKHLLTDIHDQDTRNTFTVTISQLKLSDAGLYRCGIVTTYLNNDITFDVELKVHQGKPDSRTRTTPTPRKEAINIYSISIKGAPVIFGIIGILAFVFLVILIILIRKKLTNSRGVTLTGQNNGTSIRLQDFHNTSTSQASNNLYTFPQYHQRTPGTSNVYGDDDDTSTDSSESSSTGEASRGISCFSEMKWDKTGQEADDADDYVNVSKREPEESADYVNVAPSEGRRRGSDDYVNLEPATEPDEEEDQVSEGLKGGGGNSQDAVDSDTESDEDAVVYTQIAFK
ncbi:polymeric immunoglobulin receptor-like [Acipenser oxyrinchus oxyrinchus]|nr:polymeric immunoglobulin receptor-like [Acipenser oxyrinchus oxyrinchus]